MTTFLLIILAIPALLMHRTFHTASLESSAMGQSVTMVSALETNQLSLTTPLIVLAHGVPDMFMGCMSEQETQEVEQHWQKLQAGLATLSTQGELLIAEKSGHKIHIDAHNVVVTAIRELVEHAHQ